MATKTIDLGYQVLLLSQIEPSPRNPRRHFDAGALQQLADSIREKGIIEPLIVRPMRDDNGEFSEIVAGERRYRAAKLAGLDEVPCIVRDLDDRQALELAIIENNQRVDVHPIEEAQGFEALRAMDAAYDALAIAKKIGRSESYVRGRLRLLKLSPVVREAYEANAITAAHADVLTRVAIDLQSTALRECFADLFFDMKDIPAAEDGSDLDILLRLGKWDVLGQSLAPLSQLEQWVEQHQKLDIQSDETRQQVLDALGVPEGEEPAVDPVATLLQLSADEWRGDRVGAIPARDWKLIKGKNRCTYAAKGVIVAGGKEGAPVKILDVCATKSCAMHFPQKKPASTTGGGGSSTSSNWQEQDRKRRAKEEAERKAWDALKPKAIPALVAHLSVLKTLTFNAAFVKHVLFNPYDLSRASRVETDFKVTLFDKTALMVLALSSVSLTRRDTFIRTTKAFKFDLAKVEAAHKAETKATDKPASKKTAAKKPATKKAAPAKKAVKGKKR
jgi:ParB/RepB/Spo0J family partition protein